MRIRKRVALAIVITGFLLTVAWGQRDRVEQMQQDAEQSAVDYALTALQMGEPTK